MSEQSSDRMEQRPAPRTFEEYLEHALSGMRASLHAPALLENIIKKDPDARARYEEECQDLLAQFSYESGKVFERRQHIEKVLDDALWSRVVREFVVRVAQHGLVRNRQGPALVAHIKGAVDKFLQDLLYWTKRS